MHKLLNKVAAFITVFFLSYAVEAFRISTVRDKRECHCQARKDSALVHSHHCFMFYYRDGALINNTAGSPLASRIPHHKKHLPNQVAKVVSCLDFLPQLAILYQKRKRVEASFQRIGALYYFFLIIWSQ